MFSIQKFMALNPKIQKVQEARKGTHSKCLREIDGGVSFTNLASSRVHGWNFGAAATTATMGLRRQRGEWDRSPWDVGGDRSGLLGFLDRLLGFIFEFIRRGF